MEHPPPNEASTRSPSHRATVVVAGVIVLAAAVACGGTSSTPPASGALTSVAHSSSTASTASTASMASTTGGATTAASGNGAPVEVRPPGDIPDNQAFVAYAGTGYRVVVPEGWARTTRAGTIVFTDKYNSITVASAPAATAPTPDTVRASVVPALRSTVSGYRPGTITLLHRHAGTAVRVTYGALSPVNPVTGKVANEAVEQYRFWRAGREVVLTLAAPVGSDNVDPWRKVTDSLTWTTR